MPNKIKSIDVYLEKRKTRLYVGSLSREGENFVFTYNKSYLYGDRSIPMGPDLPLTRKKFISDILFPSFEDRIPSKKNPAYQEYCKMVGIDSSEEDPIILLATLGQKGPSSFIFSPTPQVAITAEHIVHFRKELGLTVREFCELFDFSPATINRMENKTISGKESLKRLEIYYNFPEVALYEVKKNRFKINDEKLQSVEEYLQSKCKKS